MTPYEKITKDREEHKRLISLAFEHARQSKYGYIKISARRFAIIRRAGLSADISSPENPIGMTLFEFVQDCEYLTYEDMITQLKELLRSE